MQVGQTDLPLVSAFGRGRGSRFLSQRAGNKRTGGKQRTACFFCLEILVVLFDKGSFAFF